jgi:hypothetical protein
MPEQTFRSPNFYEREMEVSSTTTSSPSGVPAGVIGTARRGPAFVPTTLGNFGDFQRVFGGLDTKCPATYGVNEFLKHRSALTFLRVLGAGSNSGSEHIKVTQESGRVFNAGFKLYGDANSGSVWFLSAEHDESTSSIPSRSSSFPFAPTVDKRLVRAMIMTAKEVPCSFGNSVLTIGTKTFTISLDPSNSSYIGKVLNTDPESFGSEGYVLYAHFPVDAEVATADMSTISVVKGKDDDTSHLQTGPNGLTTTGESNEEGLTWAQAFGSFDTRFRAAASPWFISQPFGTKEFDLFKLESLDDGESGNKRFKISISDLKASVDATNTYPTFTVQIRDWNDTDMIPKILESFSGCTLNPKSSSYVARMIGDMKMTFNFDADADDERRLVTVGKYQNRSSYVRVVVHPDLEAGQVPASAMPFGFRGLNLPAVEENLDGVNDATLPPVPFRFKVTKSPTNIATGWPGQAVLNESTLAGLYWGMKFERDTNISNPNVTSDKNMLLDEYTKFLGNPGLGVLLSGSAADDTQNNKFSLARVALGIEYSDDPAVLKFTEKTPGFYMKETAYLRDGDYFNASFTISEKISSDDADPVARPTLATILAHREPEIFNRFSAFAKFTTIVSGGWDGLNILSKNERRMGDRSVSVESGGCAFKSGDPNESYTSPGFGIAVSGQELSNSAIKSYRLAADLMTDSSLSAVNVLAMPGIREPLVTDYAGGLVQNTGLSLYLMDIPSYDDDENRIFDDEIDSKKPNISYTVSEFDIRKIDNNYISVYYPDVVLDDTVNRRRVRVPASVAALGALAFNDRVSYPWFAPAGFNRAALDFVTNVPVRLNVSERDSLYDARINPIATFPRLGFVIYGQKTLQLRKSSLDRVNVRRLLLEVKRIIKRLAQGLVFEQNTPEVRNKFVAEASIQLGLIQAAAGVESFRVVMNETNNTRADFEANRLNGRVVVVPTRVIEYISIDFIVTNSGVEFV